VAYFGHSYYEENQDILKAVAIDNGEGNCVTPSAETIQDGSYAPLSRPLFAYVNAASLERPEVQEFVRYYLSDAASLAPEVGYVASPPKAYAADQEKFERAAAGSGAPDSAAGEATPAA
jgi:phosphate transport system substrate-binding protein